MMMKKKRRAVPSALLWCSTATLKRATAVAPSVELERQDRKGGGGAEKSKGEKRVEAFEVCAGEVSANVEGFLGSFLGNEASWANNTVLHTRRI